MERVTGIGGVFLRAEDPAALNAWYAEHLGVAGGSGTDAVWQQEAGPTVWSGFDADTDYFGRREQAWMINFRVRDLEKMATQLQAAGAKVEIDPETYPNGRFAQTADPEGNPIQLWQVGGVAKD